MKIFSGASWIVFHGLFLAAYCASFPPVISLGPIPGPFEVGVKRVKVIDYSRQDPFAPTPQPRALMIQIWYPIHSSAGLPKAPYFPENTARYLEQQYFLPNGTVDRVDTGCFLNGKSIHPLLSRSKSLPVIVFSPGSGTPTALYSIYNRDLASYGYIAVGIDHTYDSDPVEFPDGHLVLGILTDANNTISAEVRGQDALFVASQLSLDNLASWLPSFYDCPSHQKPTSVRLGIYGHSIGGTTAAIAVQNDSSPYVSAASLDGPFYGPILTAGFRGPFWYMAADNSGNHAGLVREWPLIRDWKNAVEVNGSTHGDFSDTPILVSQAPGTAFAQSEQKLLGPINGTRMVEIVDSYMRAFYDWTVIERPESTLLEKANDGFPEVVFENL